LMPGVQKGSHFPVEKNISEHGSAETNKRTYWDPRAARKGEDHLHPGEIQRLFPALVSRQEGEGWGMGDEDHLSTSVGLVVMGLDGVAGPVQLTAI